MENVVDIIISLIPEKRYVCPGTGGGTMQKEGKERKHREQQDEKL